MVTKTTIPTPTGMYNNSLLWLSSIPGGPLQLSAHSPWEELFLRDTFPAKLESVELNSIFNHKGCWIGRKQMGNCVDLGGWREVMRNWKHTVTAGTIYCFLWRTSVLPAVFFAISAAWPILGYGTSYWERTGVVHRKSRGLHISKWVKMHRWKKDAVVGRETQWW